MTWWTRQYSIELISKGRLVDEGIGQMVVTEVCIEEIALGEVLQSKGRQ